MEAAAAAQHALLAYVGERNRAEIEVDLVAELFPKIVRRAPGPIAAAPDRRAGGTSRRANRLLGGEDDVGKAGLPAVVPPQLNPCETAHDLLEAPLSRR